ncbi:hypothetical protein [Azospirillum doebereinerae]
MERLERLKHRGTFFPPCSMFQRLRCRRMGGEGVVKGGMAELPGQQKVAAML